MRVQHYKYLRNLICLTVYGAYVVAVHVLSSSQIPHYMKCGHWMKCAAMKHF